MFIFKKVEFGGIFRETATVIISKTSESTMTKSDIREKVEKSVQASLEVNTPKASAGVGVNHGNSKSSADVKFNEDLTGALDIRSSKEV